MTTVVDASVAIEVVRASELGLRLMDSLRGESVIAPESMDVEALSGIRRLTLRRAISVPDARRAIQNLVQWPIRRIGHRSLLGASFELRDRFSAYDAVYVALALSHGAALMTIDRKLARSASSLVSVVSD